MKQIHVGHGTTHGAMTVFPLWAERSGAPRYSYSGRHLEVREVPGGQVNSLVVGNAGDRPVLVVEGQLFEGGMQHRMATRSVLVGVHQKLAIEVACVEQGRWGGSSAQVTHGRRATPYIREAIRRTGDIQTEVWNRVALHNQPADNPTSSFVRRLDQAREAPNPWSSLRPLPGQCGVLIALGGQPYVAEVFESPLVLARQLRAILEAAALDADQAQQLATPGRRARRFIGRFESVALRPLRSAGVGEETAGRSEHVDASTLRWKGHDVHTRMSNRRHPMLVA